MLIIRPSKTPTARLMKDLDEMIKQTIELVIRERLSILSTRTLRRLEYFIMYTPGKLGKKKVVTAIFLRKRGTQAFDKITADEIDLTGASVFEFISFLKSVRSRRVKPDLNILENL